MESASRDAGSKRERLRGAFIWPETGLMTAFSIWTVAVLVHILAVL